MSSKTDLKPLVRLYTEACHFPDDVFVFGHFQSLFLLVLGVQSNPQIHEKQGSGKAQKRDLPSKKKMQTSKQNEPFNFASFYVYPPPCAATLRSAYAKDYIVQHAPCDVGIIKVDSNGPVTRPCVEKGMTAGWRVCY